MNHAVIREVIRARRAHVVVLAGLCLLNAGLYAYHSSFQRPRLVSLRNGIASARSSASVGLPQDADAVFRLGVSDLAEWNKRIPAKKEFARILGDLYETARNNSLTIAGISYRPAPVKGEGLLTYAISLSVAGKYAQVKSFIADVSRMRDIVVIDQVSLNNSKLTEEYVDLKLELTAYFRMER
jgi:type IV pilus assembly protein PilO